MDDENTILVNNETEIEDFDAAADDDELSDTTKDLDDYEMVTAMSSLIGRRPFEIYGTRKCIKDYQCGLNMECLDNVCYCTPGYIPKEDYCVVAAGFQNQNQNNYKNSNGTAAVIISNKNLKRYTFDACKSRPCSLGAYCESLSNAKFICHCPLGKWGKLCEKSSPISMPSFREYSFYELTLPSSINRLDDFQLEIEFKSSVLDGKLLFLSENIDGSGDSISLLLREGFVELRFENKQETLKILETKSLIAIDQFHSIYVERKKSTITIQLDDLTPQKRLNVSGAKLAIGNSLILGNLDSLAKISSHIKSKLNATFEGGFVGCIQYLKLNEKTFNLAFPSNDILNGRDIVECAENGCAQRSCANEGRCKMVGSRSTSGDTELRPKCICKANFYGSLCELKRNACSSWPCRNTHKNESVCVPTSDGSFQCICSRGYDGKYCEKSASIKRPFVASFNMRSFIRKPGIYLNFKQIEIFFLTRKPNGLLMYNGQSENSNDLIAIKLQDGFVVFELKLNEQSYILISRNPVRTKRWHKLRILNENSFIKMSIDSEMPIKCGPLKMPLDYKFNRSLYIGHVANDLEQNDDRMPMNSKYKHVNFFKGAFQKFEIIQTASAGYLLNEEKFYHSNDIRKNAIELGSIREYRGFPCNHTRCLNNGVCVPMLSRYRCDCQSDYRGEHCQQHLSKQNGNALSSSSLLNEIITRKPRHHKLQPSSSNESDNVTISPYAILISKSNLTVPLYLDGHTELTYRNRISELLKIQSSNKFEIRFKTEKSNGLLMYTGNGNLNSYLLIGLQNGRIVYSFSLPKQKRAFTLTSTKRVNDNKWHTVIIERNKRKTILNIDNKQKLNGTFDEINYIGFGNLNTDGLIRLGGYRRLPVGLAQHLYRGFQGCIADFKIDDRPIDLVNNNLNKNNFYPQTCKAKN